MKQPYKVQNRTSESRRVKFVKNGGTVSFPKTPTASFVENSREAGFCLTAITPLPSRENATNTITLTSHPMGTDGRVSLFINDTLIESKRFLNKSRITDRQAWFNSEFGAYATYSGKEFATFTTALVSPDTYRFVFEDDDLDYVFAGTTNASGDVNPTLIVEQYRLVFNIMNNKIEIPCTGAIDFAGVLVLPDEVSGTMRTSTQSIDFADNGEMVVGLETLGFRALELTTWTPPIPPVTISCSGANAVIKTINPVTIKGNVAITMIATRNGEVSESTIPNIPVTEMPLGVFIEWVYGRDNAIKIGQGGPLGIAIARIGSTGYDPTLTQLKYKIETDDEIKFTPAQGDILSPAVSISSKQFIACMEITPVQDINCVGEPDEMIFPGGIQVRGLVEFVGYENKPSNGYKNIATFSNNVAEFTDLVTALRMDNLSPVFDVSGVAFRREANGDLRVMSNAVSGVSASVYIRATEMRISPPPTGNVLIGKLTSGDDTVEFCVSSI